MPGGQKRSRSEYVALFREFAESGLRLTEFARRKEIPYSTLAMWRKRLRDQRELPRKAKSPSGRTRQRKERQVPATREARAVAPSTRSSNGNGTTPLLPVELALSATSSGSAPVPRYEVVLRTGLVVRVPWGFETEDLRRLLQVLESAGC